MPRDRDDRDDRWRDDDRSRHREHDDAPPIQAGNGMAAAALVLGVVSIFFGPLTGILAVVFGLVALRRPTGKGMATAGLITGGLFSIAWVGATTFGVGKLREAAERQREAAERERTNHNFKQLGLAAHNYESSMGVWPTPFVRRPNEPQWQPVNTPDLSDRLSWRVSLLPYLEYDHVYRQFDMTKPWDSPQNQPLSGTVVAPYADADTRTDPTTRVRCFYDNRAMFDTRLAVRIADISDGTSNTILYVEGGDKVTWSRFQDYKFDPNGPLPALGKPDKPSFTVVMGDGYVRTVRKSVSPAVLKAAITRDGGEVISLD